MRLLRSGLVLGLVIAASSCGGDDSASTSTGVGSTTSTSPATTTIDSTAPSVTDPSATTVPETSAPETTVPATTVPETTVPETTVPETTAPPTTTTEPPVPTTTSPPTMVDVRVYFAHGEHLTITRRQVEGPAVLRGALEAVLAGPTAGETTAGLFTLIPDGTTLRDLNLADGLATVDLDSTFESGGGSLSMQARIAQIVFTATQFDNVDRVEFWLDGVAVDTIGGEGIEVGDTVGRNETYRELTGGIIVELPMPGATVTSPFTFIGEGDVFEGDFPLQIRRNGTQIGDTLIVRAGAWGMWSDFEETVTVEAGPGPIELVMWDEGGCGPPECPEAVEIVIPLVLAG